jgi:5-methylcytosine-specific restriction endonuclease McrA
VTWFDPRVPLFDRPEAWPGWGDAQRYFTPDQGAVMLYRQRYRCRDCTRSLRDREYQLHHVQPWAEGGPTETWNGVALCVECHKDGHSRTRLWPRFHESEGLGCYAPSAPRETS